jgi:predicted dithiol-disulfide oxidoreductase (DUF899 family)
MPKIKTTHEIENRKVVAQKDWLAARKKLLLKEKKFSKLRGDPTCRIEFSCPTCI